MKSEMEHHWMSKIVRKYITPDLTGQKRRDALELRNELQKAVKKQGWSGLDHQKKMGPGETVAVSKVKKTASKEKIKPQDTAVKLVQKLKICMENSLRSIRLLSLV